MCVSRRCLLACSSYQMLWFCMQSTVDLKPEQQSLVIEATKRGRGGKTVTVIKGLQLKQDSLDALCKALKMKIGSGGTVKDGEIELQV